VTEPRRTERRGPPEEAVGARSRSLFERHGRMVLGLCRVLLRDSVEAEDAAQQTFVSAHRALLDGTAVRNDAAWLAAIARNECRTRIVARMREPLALSYDELVDAAGTAPEQEPAQLSDDLRRALAELPERQRQAVVLRDLYGLRYREVGAALGVSRPAVESLLFRARSRLRVRLRPVAGALVLPIALRESLAQALPGFAAAGSGGAAVVGAAGASGVIAKLGSAPIAAKLAAGAVAAGAGAGSVVVLEDNGASTRRPALATTSATKGERPVADEPEQLADAVRRRNAAVGADDRDDVERRGPGDGDDDADGEHVRHGSSSGPGSSGDGSQGSGSGREREQTQAEPVADDSSGPGPSGGSSTTGSSGPGSGSGASGATANSGGSPHPVEGKAGSSGGSSSSSSGGPGSSGSGSGSGSDH
jgi:RNA polymerase sigma factor (sigma-70 family)